MSLRSLMIPVILTMTATSVSAANKWTKVGTSRYSISMPGSPQKMVMKHQFNGQKVDQHVHISSNGATSYFFSVMQFPIEVPSYSNSIAIIRNAQESAMRKQNGKLKSVRTLRFGRHTGREIRFESRANGVTLYWTHRTVLVGNTLYQQMVISRISKADAKDAEKFFHSLRVRREARKPLI